MENVTDVNHTTDSINAHSQRNAISEIETTLKDNPPGTHHTIADHWPVVQPALSFLANAFPAGSPWHHALTDFISVANVELGYGEKAKGKGKNGKK